MASTTAAPAPLRPSGSQTGAREPAAGVSTLEWLVLAGVLLVAAGARIYRLDSSLWYDEIETLLDFVRLPTGELIRSLNSNNHLFYNLQAQAAIALFSESAWSLRLPAVAFGLASLVAIWALSRRATGPVEALVVAFLLAISYDHVWFSQNGRGYTGLLFWTTCATLLFARGLAGADWRTWTLYALSMAAASYTHLTALFFFLGHGIVYLSALALRRLRPDVVRRCPALAGMADWTPIFGFALGAAATLALYAPLLSQMPSLIHSTSVDASKAAELHRFARMPQDVAVTLEHTGSLAPFVLGAGLVAFGVGAIGLARRQPVIAAAYLLHVPLTLLILLGLNARIWPRFFLIDIGFIYLAIVHGTFAACRYVARRLGTDEGAPRRSRLLVATAIGVMTAGSLWLLAGNYAHPKQDFAGAAAYVERQRGLGDAVTSIGVARLAFRLYAPHWSAVDSVADLDALRRSASRTWVVAAYPKYGPPPPFGEAIAKDFERVTSLPGTLPNGDVVIYRSRPR